LFKREHHLRIASILQNLNSDLLRDHKCYFGGGTAIVLKHNEYRESLDIDFIISDLGKYKNLRQRLTCTKGFNSILKAPNSVQTRREIRADQYGIRTFLDAGNYIEIKFEIVLEARVELGEPSKDDSICGITSLTRLDMATTKILANSDRWYDDSVFSRDAIDLAMLDLSGKELSEAISKASIAYGDSSARDLKQALTALRDRPGRLSQCMEMLKMGIPEALLWQKMRKILQQL
jgi:hypothetical protein